MRCARCLLLLLTCCWPLLAQDQLPTLRLGDTVYCGALALGQRLAIKVEWQGAQHAAQLTAGTKWLQLSANTILARTADGRVLLPTCPVERNSMLYVPAAAVVTLLGGSSVSADGKLQLTLGEAKATLDVPALAAPADATEALTAALDDPRVPIAQMGTGYTLVSGLRWGLDQFNAVVGPLQPLLAGVGKSRLLALLGHIPVVGGFATTAQDAMGAVGEAAGLVGRLASFDERQGAPLRRAVTETRGLMAKPDAAAAAKLVPTWQAALPALDDRIGLLDQGSASLTALGMALYLLDLKGRELTTTIAGEKYKIPFVLGPARSITDELRAQVQAARWDAAEQKAFYQRLIAIVEPAQK
ncbi:MAG: hypothetical protein HZB16_14660 [Armatimonadetes bacterium]|nr:hypothetical protein [Armatimonadota bacterium]